MAKYHTKQVEIEILKLVLTTCILLILLITLTVIKTIKTIELELGNDNSRMVILTDPTTLCHLGQIHGK